MEKKVYEGYKKTSSSVKKATGTSSKTETVAKKVPQKSGSKKTSSTKPNAKLTSKAALSKPRIAMFIDVDNVGISRENLLEILFYANGKYNIEACTLYGFNDDTLPGIREIANEYNMVTVGKMKFKTPGVNALDSRLLVDAYECAVNNKGKIDMIFVWCYPCDLSNLFEKIIGLGINTATINNNVFDCKNKFVSQTFKLYSPYDFSLDQSTYGEVKNAPLEENDNLNTKVANNSEIKSEETTTSTTMPSLSNEKVNDENKNDNSSQQPGMIDGVIPPVLPRREIVERSSSRAPRPAAIDGIDTQNPGNTSVVGDIARKLNLQMDGSDDIGNGTGNAMGQSENDAPQMSNSEIFIDMMKQAGFGDLVDKKSLKYEDTIGDL